MKIFKVIFIGTGGIGKSALLMTYNEKSFPEQFIPTIYGNIFSKFQIENQEIEIDFCDIARNESYEQNLQKIYEKTDLIAFCFSINDYHSFKSIESLWIPDVEEYAPKNSKRILIGTKIDLRNNEERINELKKRNEKLITKEEGIEFTKKINAIKYFECSSLNQKGIETIFNEIALICIGKYKEIKQEEQKNKKGCILN